MRVAVVCGGPSVEAEVSRVSARAVAAALAPAHEVHVLKLDAALPEALRTLLPDVVFPVCHGGPGEDGSLQGVLEVVGLPYVGSGVLASALAMDKAAARVHFAAAGLPIAAGRTAHTPRDAAALVQALGSRLVVKPTAGGSALGVTRLELVEGVLEPLEQALAAALAQGPSALVERFVRGDEVTCGVLDAGGLRALLPTRIESLGAAFYDFESRYAPGKSAHECPAPYPAELLDEIQRVAVAAHQTLGCRDLSRADFVVDAASRQITVLEVNTMPGFTPTSLYPEAAAVAGLSFAQLCGLLVATARQRGAGLRLSGVAFPGSGRIP